MSKINGKHFVRLSIFCLLLAFSQAAFSQDKEWREITPAELAMKTPKVEADADAEAIFWETRIDDSSDNKLSKTNYVRVKIFNERGREKFSKVDIPFLKGLKIKDVAARVIKTDGSIVELKKEEIFEREIVKASGIKIKSKSFAVPNIEPGVIIEYRYRELIEDGSAKGMRLAFQRDIPIQTLSYYYKPYSKSSPNFQSFNMTDTKFVKDDKGFYLAQRSDVPSFKEEPRMPPEDQVRPWVLLQGVSFNITNVSDLGYSFRIKDPNNASQYWGAVGSERAELTKIMVKPNGDIKKAAADITAAASTPDEKLKKLYEFCQTQIKNTTFDTTLTDEARQKLPAFKSLADVLKRKSGNVMEIDLLFGAMASSLGLDTRIAHLSNRNEMFFDPKMTNEYFIRPGGIAVMVGTNWKFFDPGSSFLPYGMMPWSEEGVWALLVGEKAFDWVRTPVTGYDKSAAKRTGKFTLSEDGTLEGDVRIEYAGQLGYRYKMDNYDQSAGKREEDLKAEIKRHVSTAEISNVGVENSNEPEKPFVYTLKVRIPNYAQRTGKRLFLQPGFFEYGENPVFSGGTRKYDVYFPYPWAEMDTIEIALPKNFALDNADAPATIGDGQKISLLNIFIGINKTSNTLVYKREFHFGGGGNILFPATSYQQLKNLFDAFNKADTHTVTLKQS
jgi:hypothetical protein